MLVNANTKNVKLEWSGVSMKTLSILAVLLALDVAGATSCSGVLPKTVATREPIRATLTFDDSLKDHLLIAATMLEERGWRGTFCIVTDWVGKDSKHLTWDDEECTAPSAF